jgi:hypothetical protein
MKRFVSVLSLGTFILVGAHAAAGQPLSQSAMLKRQLNDCMTRRMSAQKTTSYNEALRGCKARQQPRKDALASNSPAATDTKAH